MNDYVYWGSTNDDILPLKGLLSYRTIPYSKSILHNMGFMDGEAQRTYTALRFPRKAEDSKGRQVQKMNYDIFIKTMADLVRKYTPKMRKEY